MSIIVQYAASEKLEGNAWESMCRALIGMTYDEALLFLGTEEHAFKEEHGPLPNAYRSAKSVVLSALRLDIPMFGDNGMPLGKTAMQTLIKERKAAAKEPPSPADAACAMLRKVECIYLACTDDTHRATIKVAAQHIVERMVR